MSDHRTRAQRWADVVTEFSGSWAFIVWFVGLCVVWVGLNATGAVKWDPYPYMFLNWMLTVISTFQNPFIMLSQNRQNETDRENTLEILSKLKELQDSIDRLEKGKQ
jgi:uncharacterized membrane protein